MKVTSQDLGPVKGPNASYALEASFRLWESLDSPVSLSCWLLARYGEWDQLVQRKLDPLAYADAAAFQLDYLAVSVLSKAEFLQTSFDRRETALETFRRAERQCQDANERLWLYMEGRLTPKSERVHLALQRAIRLIRSILGDAPSRRVMDGRFGPGATSLVSRLVCVAEKYKTSVDVTPGLFPYLLDVVGPRWLHEIEEVSLNASNRVSFVPKNAKTFRAIAIEPHVNGYAQLGVAGLIRDCLKRKAGIDLEVQAETNRHLASIARDFGLATIDLSAASDTVSRACVWLLLPEGWVQVLDACRSHYGILDGVEFEYEKFSSMGNGFTFELETLIFYAVARACGGSKNWTSVFGDDIICESECYDLLAETLAFLGFTVNKEKTFASGPFRESCGHDYFDGHFVRPFFWKDLDVPTWFKVANDLRSLSRQLLLQNPRVSARLHRAWLDTIRVVPRRLANRVPAGYGAVGIEDDDRYVRKHVSTDIVSSIDGDGVELSFKRERVDLESVGWDGYFFDVWLFRPDPVPIHASWRAMLHCLDGGGYEGTGNTSFRGIGCWRRGRMYTLGKRGGPGMLSVDGMYRIGHSRECPAR